MWAEIDEIGQSGVASQCFSVHDTKDIYVSGETLTMEIVGFNHDDLTSGGKAAYTFGMKHLMADTRQMNTSNTNSGSFVGSAMYSYLRNTVLPNLPEEVRSHIKTINKKTLAGNQSSSVRTDSMQIFLFSVTEVVGSDSWLGSTNEGSQYSAFSTNDYRTKKLSNGDGNAQAWWLRSPAQRVSGCFEYIGSSGGAGIGDGGAVNRRGVCFGFCI